MKDCSACPILPANRGSARAEIIRLLLTQPEQTVKNITAKTGIKRDTVLKTLARLRKDGIAHISHYTEEAGDITAVWAPGYCVDANPPKWSRIGKKKATEEAKRLAPIPRPKLGAWGVVW